MERTEPSARPARPPRPAYTGYFADPFVWRHDGEYYAVGTGGREAEGCPSELVFPLLRSDEFLNWRPAGRALLRPDPTLGDSFWAPEVAFHEGQFYLYYSVGFGDARHQLRVAISDRPLGPYQDCGHALLNPNAHPFAIDASPFRDVDGRWLLFFARDFLDENNGRVGTALAAAPLKSMTQIDGEPTTVLRARYDWQRFQANRSIYGAIYDWHTLEGPAVIRRGGLYYCFYSAGRWENETYGVDYATADHVLGPYSDGDNQAGPRVLRTVSGQLTGPGHNCIVTGPDGADWIIFHAWDPEMTARRMFMEPLAWTPVGPRRRERLP